MSISTFNGLRCRGKERHKTPTFENCTVESGNIKGSSYCILGGIVGNVSVNSNRPCTSAAGFSLNNCKCLAAFEKKNSIYDGGGLVGALFAKDLYTAQNLPVYYNIGIHDSSFGGSGYNKTNFASVIAHPSFYRSDMNTLGQQGSRLKPNP